MYCDNVTVTKKNNFNTIVKRKVHETKTTYTHTHQWQSGLKASHVDYDYYYMYFSQVNNIKCNAIECMLNSFIQKPLSKICRDIVSQIVNNIVLKT